MRTQVDALSITHTILKNNTQPLFPEVDYPPPPLVKELSRCGNEAALYQLIFSDGHQSWRIFRPIRYASGAIPGSIFPEFQSEASARAVYSKLTQVIH